MEIREVKNIKELNKAIEFASKQFVADIKSIQPKIYGETTNGRTFICLVNDVIIGMFSIYEFKYKKLKAMSLGSICVDSTYRNKGVMKSFFAFLEKNNYFGNDFVTLNGDKKRYENFGFCKVIESYAYRIKISRTSDISITKGDKTNSLFLYNIFRNININRDKEYFFDILKSNNNQVFIFEKNNIFSYAVYNEKNNIIVEYYGGIEITDICNKIGEIYNLKEIYVEAPYNKHDKYLGEISKGYEIKLKTSIKILNIPCFIKNICYLRNKINSEFIFKVDNNTYKLKIKEGKISINYSKEVPLKRYDTIGFTYALFDYCNINDGIGEFIKPVLDSSITSLECI